MNLKECLLKILLVAAITIFVFADPLFALEQETSFPQYGRGPIQVRIYTDYFCPPCRGMEPALEPLLRDLIKRNVIRVTLMDTPVRKYSPLYTRYFLYALKAKNDLEHALKVRNILFDAAAMDEITNKEGIEELFRSKGIPYTAFEHKPTFDRFNALIKEDIIPATPTCVIIRAGKKESFVGGPDIIAALKRLL